MRKNAKWFCDEEHASLSALTPVTLFNGKGQKGRPSQSCKSTTGWPEGVVDESVENERETSDGARSEKTKTYGLYYPLRREAMRRRHFLLSPSRFLALCFPFHLSRSFGKSPGKTSGNRAITDETSLDIPRAYQRVFPLITSRIPNIFPCSCAPHLRAGAVGPASPADSSLT